MLIPDAVRETTDAGGASPPKPAAPALFGPRRLVRGWGRATGSRSAVTRPAGDPAWRDLLAAAGPRGLIARGGGCSYGDAAQNAGGIVAMTGAAAPATRFSVEDGTVVADAGVTLGALVRALAPQGWTLPVLPGTARVTVGGAIAADVHGKNHVRYGTFGSQVREMSVLTPGLGPMTMGPRTNPDAFWATVGGLGLTGVIRRARLSLIPLDSWLMWCVDTIAEDLPSVMSGLRAAAVRSPYAVAWIDGRRRGRQLGGGIISRTEPVLPSRSAPPDGGGEIRLRSGTPTLPGAGIAWGPAAAAANSARLFVARRRPRQVRPLPQALFPLDAVPGWPGLHGRRGLVQYQFVVPFGAEDVIAAALAGPQHAGRPATLAALKVFGAANPGPLSFPVPGWSLALDFPADPALAPVLDELDTRVAAVGGRVYLVKDSRLRPDLLEVMYPRLSRWRAERAVLDPDRVMASDLGRRLHLTDEIGGFHG
jgi:decaprenylphospho-beta-D-ribofuranose 2-oxidase